MSKLLEPSMKKQEILNFISIHYNADDPFKISRRYLVEKFKDVHYPKTKIEAFIEELINDKILDENPINLEIVYPLAKHREVKAKWKKFLGSYRRRDFMILSAYLIMVLYAYFFSREYLQATLAIPILLVFVYGIINLVISNLEEKSHYFRKINFSLLFANLVTITSFILLAYAFSKFVIKETLTTGYLLTAVGTGVIVGSLAYKIFKNKE